MTETDVSVKCVRSLPSDISRFYDQWSIASRQGEVPIVTREECASRLYW